jgi:putative inorganic carbon (HCO3(-)) transporter
VRRLLVTLVLAGGVLGAMTIQEFNATELATATTATDRPQASFRDPNTLAMLLALALPAGLVATVTGPRALWPLCLVATASTFVGVALSLSRGGMLAAGAGLLFMLLWRPVRRGALAAALVLLVLNLSGLGSLSNITAFDAASERLASVAYAAGGGVDPRFTVWARTPQIVADHPIVGVGAHNFVTVSPEYGLLDPYSRRAIVHGHNTALTVLAELGVLGLLALAWLVFALARLLARACTRTTGPDRGLAFGVAAAFVAWLVHGLVEYTLNSNVMAAMTFLLAGCAVVLARGAAAPQAAAER